MTSALSKNSRYSSENSTLFMGSYRHVLNVTPPSNIEKRAEMLQDSTKLGRVMNPECGLRDSANGGGAGNRKSSMDLPLEGIPEVKEG